MHISFLFWNMMKHPLQERLTNIVSANEIDIVMLAECAIAPNAIEEALNSGVMGDYRYFPSGNNTQNFYSFRVLIKLR